MCREARRRVATLPGYVRSIVKNAPDMQYRKGITLTALNDKFPTDAAA